jgi:hypothetical protein
MIGSTKRHLLPALTLSVFSVAQPAAAQETGGAFADISVGIDITANINHDTLHEYWDAGPGFELSFDTPFYFGRAELGAQYQHFTAKEQAQPDFESLFAYLGWGYDWAMSPKLGWYNGLRAGSFIQRYDISGSEKHEQELGLSLVSRFRLSLGAGWNVDVSARYREVFTHERIRLFYIAGGISRSFKSPRWLKEFLD